MNISEVMVQYLKAAGIAAKIVHPERPVVSFVGDGGFAMVQGDLGTLIEREQERRGKVVRAANIKAD